MFVDGHHHLWRYMPESFPWIDPRSAINRDFVASDLLAALASRGVGGAIAVQARQVPEETGFLLEIAEHCPAIIGVVGWIDLRADDIAERIEADLSSRLVGYRHVVQDEPEAEFLLANDFVRGVRQVISRGLSYDLLVDHRQLATMPAFLDRVGEGRFILDHAAKPSIGSAGWHPWSERIAAAAAYPHLMCKVSGLVTEADHATWTPADVERYLDHVFELFGPDRLIWGSDWPVCLLAADYGRVFDLIADYVSRHCPQAEAAIFGGNALRAYALGQGGR